jgi:hypothetical protein
MNVKNYKYKWDNMDWFLDPSGSNEIKIKLDYLVKYLTFERKQSMSRYEARLYDWILKKQYKADPIELIEWSEEIDSNGWAHREKISQQYYLGYYNPTRKHPVYQEDEYAKEQQKYRARHHTRIK